MTTTTYWLIAGTVMLLAVVVGGWVGGPKGRGGLGLLLGFVLSWLGVLIVALIKGEPRTDDERADARMRSGVGLVAGLLGIAATVGVFFLAQQVTASLDETVERMTGTPARCQVEGWMILGGQRADVYGCDGARRGGALGCFAQVGGHVEEVTHQARLIAAAGGVEFPCAAPAGAV